MFTFFLSSTAGGWDISTASYASKSFDVSAEDGATRDLYIKSDGYSLYTVGAGNSKVFQYTLSTAWDISTASYASKSLDTTSQDSLSSSIYFKSDGSAIYVLGLSTDTVYQYTLSTPWDISTASYASKSAGVSSQDTFPIGITFNYDGSVMYMTGEGNKTIYQYTLSTPWDVSTASYASKSFNVNSQDQNPKETFFRPSGSSIYVIGDNSDAVYQYSLSTPWDISTASYVSKSFSVSSEDTFVTSVFFRQDGKLMYMSGTTAPDTIYQYTLA